MITKLLPNQFIVVGTNLNGHHYGGGAKQAHEQFGLAWDISEGLCGQTYAFPTLEREMTKRGVKALERSRDRLYATANALPEYEFLLTPVGTGIAGYPYETIEQLFSNLPSNIKKVGWDSNKVTKGE